nr:MAG TPA: hypothetical protein [Caudoviricetes sp.]
MPTHYTVSGAIQTAVFLFIRACMVLTALRRY